MTTESIAEVMQTWEIWLAEGKLQMDAMKKQFNKCFIPVIMVEHF